MFKCSPRLLLLSFLPMVHAAGCLRPYLNGIIRAEPSSGSALKLGLVRHLRGGGEGDGQATPVPENQANDVTIKFLKRKVIKLKIFCALSLSLSFLQQFQNPMVV